MRFVTLALTTLLFAAPARAMTADQAFADAVLYCAGSTLRSTVMFEIQGYQRTQGAWLEKTYGDAKVGVLPQEECKAMLYGTPVDRAAMEASVDAKLRLLPPNFAVADWARVSLETLGPGHGYDKKTYLQRNGREAVKLTLTRTGLAFGKPDGMKTSYVATVRRFRAFSHIGINGPVGAAVTDALSNCARATSKPTLAVLARAMGYVERDPGEHTLHVLDDAKVMSFFSTYDGSCSVYVTSAEADDSGIMRAAKDFISSGGEATARDPGVLSDNEFKIKRVEYIGTSAFGPRKLVLDHRVPRSPTGQQAQRFRLTLSKR